MESLQTITSDYELWRQEKLKMDESHELREDYGKIEMGNLNGKQVIVLYKRMEYPTFAILPYGSGIKAEWGINPETRRLLFKKIYYPLSKFNTTVVQKIAESSWQCPYCTLGVQVLAGDPVEKLINPNNNPQIINLNLDDESMESFEKSERVAESTIDSFFKEFLLINSLTPTDFLFANGIATIGDAVLNVIDNLTGQNLDVWVNIFGGGLAMAIPPIADAVQTGSIPAKWNNRIGALGIEMLMNGICKAIGQIGLSGFDLQQSKPVKDVVNFFDKIAKGDIMGAFGIGSGIGAPISLMNMSRTLKMDAYNVVRENIPMVHPQIKPNLITIRNLD